MFFPDGSGRADPSSSANPASEQRLRSFPSHDNGSKNHYQAETGTEAIMAAVAAAVAAKQSRTNVFVRHVLPEIDEAKLYELFSIFGKITSHAVMRNIHTGESLGTAFVRFAEHEQAKAAMEMVNNFVRTWQLHCSGGSSNNSPQMPAATAAEMLAKMVFMNSAQSPNTVAAKVKAFFEKCARETAAYGKEGNQKSDDEGPPWSSPQAKAPAIPPAIRLQQQHYTLNISVQWAKKEHDSTPTGMEKRKMMKLFVRNIPVEEATVERLTALFERYGTVKSVTIHRDTLAAAHSTAAVAARERHRNAKQKKNSGSAEVTTTSAPLPVGSTASDPGTEEPLSVDGAALPFLKEERRIAFITYADEGAAGKAAEAVHNTKPFAETCKGVPLMVKLAEEVPLKQGRGGSGGGSGRNAKMGSGSPQGFVTGNDNGGGDRSGHGSLLLHNVDCHLPNANEANPFASPYGGYLTGAAAGAGAPHGDLGYAAPSSAQLSLFNNNGGGGVLMPPQPYYYYTAPPNVLEVSLSELQRLTSTQLMDTAAGGPAGVTGTPNSANHLSSGPPHLSAGGGREVTNPFIPAMVPVHKVAPMTALTPVGASISQAANASVFSASSASATIAPLNLDVPTMAYNPHARTETAELSGTHSQLQSFGLSSTAAAPALGYASPDFSSGVHAAVPEAAHHASSLSLFSPSSSFASSSLTQQHLLQQPPVRDAGGSTHGTFAGGASTNGGGNQLPPPPPPLPASQRALLLSAPAEAGGMGDSASGLSKASFIVPTGAYSTDPPPPPPPPPLSCAAPMTVISTDGATQEGVWGGTLPNPVPQRSLQSVGDTGRTNYFLLPTTTPAAAPSSATASGKHPGGEAAVPPQMANGGLCYTAFVSNGGAPSQRRQRQQQQQQQQQQQRPDYLFKHSNTTLGAANGKHPFHSLPSDAQGMAEGRRNGNGNARRRTSNVAGGYSYHVVGGGDNGNGNVRSHEKSFTAGPSVFTAQDPALLNSITAVEAPTMAVLPNSGVMRYAGPSVGWVNASSPPLSCGGGEAAAGGTPPRSSNAGTADAEEVLADEDVFRLLNAFKI